MVQKIKNNWENPLDFINRTIFVLSKVDNIEDEKVKSKLDYSL